MLANEIREMTDEDIRARVADLQEERFRLRFRGATETLDNPMRLRFIRRDIARLLTILRERELAGGAAGTGAAGEGKGAKGEKGGKGEKGKSAGTSAKKSAKKTAAPAAKKAAGAKRAAPRAER